jgi:hypothetical protein
MQKDIRTVLGLETEAFKDLSEPIGVEQALKKNKTLPQNENKPLISQPDTSTINQQIPPLPEQPKK